MLHHRLDGPESAPVLALSHALGIDHTMWEPQAELVGPFRLLRFDTRGHGASPVPAGPSSLADLGRDVLGLLDQLGIPKVTFCGISLGGLVGQWLGIHAPERLDGLVLCNTAARIASRQVWQDRIALVEREGVGSLVASAPGRWFTPDFKSAAVARIQATLAATSPVGYASCCAALRDADLRAEVAGIRVPTLVISGAQDPVTTPAEGQYLVDSIPGARGVTLAASHLSSVEAAAAFNQAILAQCTREEYA